MTRANKWFGRKLSTRLGNQTLTRIKLFDQVNHLDPPGVTAMLL